MLTDIYLYGALGEKYGRHHRFDVVSVQQAARALVANYKEFYKDFMASNYEIRVGEEAIDETQLRMRNGKQRPIHFIPVAIGAKNNSTAKIIVAAVVLAVATGGASLAASNAAIGAEAAATSAAASTAASVGSFAWAETAFTIFGANVSWGTIAMQGVTMALGGISSMLSPTPKAGDYGSRNPVDQRASYLFNGAVNQSAEGIPVPIVYGRFRVGSVVASAGITTEELLT